MSTTATPPNPQATHATDPSPDSAAAHAHRLASSRYENFSVLSRLVPHDLRPDFAAVYAFCRHADDLADEHDGSPNALANALTNLRDYRHHFQLTHDRAIAGLPPDPEHHLSLQALAPTIARHGLPAAPFHRLLDAFELDQTLTRYDTWDQLLRYCTLSANPVGHLVLTLGGHRPPDETPHTADLYRLSDLTCTALQLTNHWQDVRRDLLERDRIYLPATDTAIAHDELRLLMARGESSPPDSAARARYIKALRPLVRRTHDLFHEARDLPRLAGPRIGPVIGLLAAGGRAVLRRIDLRGCTTLWHRPRLGPFDKARLIARASLARALAPARSPSPTSPNSPGAPA